MEEYWIFIIIAVIFVAVGAALIIQGIKIGQGLIPFEEPDKEQDKVVQSQFLTDPEEKEAELEYEKNKDDSSLDS